MSSTNGEAAYWYWRGGLLVPSFRGKAYNQSFHKQTAHNWRASTIITELLYMKQEKAKTARNTYWGGGWGEG